MDDFRLVTGNKACVYGALSAGMDFFAGYPITPATSISEFSSVLLPAKGGKFIQMEDEIASIAAVIGASTAGARAMTATSGPGFSLMQENIGYATMAEIPCVIVDVMRLGPSQGIATMGAQGDIMQSIWGRHGDCPSIVLTPNSVKEIYSETIRAFYLAELLRMPIILLYDAVLSKMEEKINLHEKYESKIINRKRPNCEKPFYLPYEDDGSSVPPMAVFGDGYRWYTTGLAHNRRGLPENNNLDEVDAQYKRLNKKIIANLNIVQSYEEYYTEDASIILVSIGIVSRAAKYTVKKAREMGINAGLFRPKTLWPFPYEQINRLSKKCKAIVVCEMNGGQLYHIVREAVDDNVDLRLLSTTGGKCPTYSDIISSIMGYEQNGK